MKQKTEETKGTKRTERTKDQREHKKQSEPKMGKHAVDRKLQTKIFKIKQKYQR